MRKALACGIDFGTTNSSISIAYDSGEVELVDIDPSATMPYSLPSIVYVDRSGLQQAGHEAIQQFMITGPNSTSCGNCSLVIRNRFSISTDCLQHSFGGRCQDARLISGLKSLLAPTDCGDTHSWAKTYNLEDFVAIVIGELKRRADYLVDDNLRKVVLGYPVAFSGAEGPNFEELQERAESRLQRAAEKAGFTNIEFYPEPAAVMLDQYSADGHMLAVDFGGGTYDVAVLEKKGMEAEIVGLQGAAVGGEHFDKILFDRVVADAIGLNQQPRGRNLPNYIRNSMRTLSGVAYLLRDNNLRPALFAFAGAGANISAIDEILFGGQAYNFYSAVEGAKIELSESPVSKVHFHVQGRIDVSATIRRTDFDSWISPFLDRVDLATIAALDEANIQPQDIHTVLRTGGSSLTPQFIDRLESRFPNAEIRERPAFTSVAYGLGRRALEVWGNA